MDTERTIDEIEWLGAHLRSASKELSNDGPHSSLSFARRLGSDKRVLSTNKLVARFLMCSIVPRRSCNSSSTVGSRSPSVAAIAFAQSSRMRSSILRCGGGMNRGREESIGQNGDCGIPCKQYFFLYSVHLIP